MSAYRSLVPDVWFSGAFALAFSRQDCNTHPWCLHHIDLRYEDVWAVRKLRYDTYIYTSSM